MGGNPVSHAACLEMLGCEQDDCRGKKFSKENRGGKEIM